MNMKKPKFEHKVSAAITILIYGVGDVGLTLKGTLMWPYKNISDKQVRAEAATFLSHVLTGVLQESHPERIEQILKDQDERLSSVLEIEQQDASIPCRDEEPYPD